MKLEWYKDQRRMSWNDAVNYCESLGGGWRLPTVVELASLFDYDSGKPTGDTQANYYWSSSNYAYYPNFAWAVSMFDGYVINLNKTLSYCVWPVRAGKEIK